MRLRGAFAGPETIVPLGNRTGMLAESDPRPANAEDLESLLVQPGRVISTGVRVTSMDLYGGLGLWLAAREPGLGRLSAFGVASPGQGAPDPDPATASGRSGMGMVASAHGCAALVPMSDPGGTGRAGLRTPFEIGACPFGSEGPELAARLAATSAAGTPPGVLHWPACGSAPTRPGRPARRAAGRSDRQAAHPAGAGLAGRRAQPGLTPRAGRAGGRPRASTARTSPSTSSGTCPPAVQSAQRMPMKLPMPAYT